MQCRGIDLRTGDALEVSGSTVIDGVDHLIAPEPGLPYVAPGFIDIQVNGFAGGGLLLSAGRHGEGSAIDSWVVRTGVTRILPTVITGSPENMSGALRNLARAKASLAEGGAMEGFHVEGPNISPDDGPRGAHPSGGCANPISTSFGAGRGLPMEGFAW